MITSIAWDINYIYFRYFFEAQTMKETKIKETNKNEEILLTFVLRNLIGSSALGGRT